MVQALANEWARSVLLASPPSSASAAAAVAGGAAAGGASGDTDADDGAIINPPPTSDAGGADGPTRLLPFGSYRLDVHDPSSDLDLLLVAPRGVERAGFFGAFVERHLRGHPSVGLIFFFQRGWMWVWA